MLWLEIAYKWHRFDIVEYLHHQGMRLENDRALELATNSISPGFYGVLTIAHLHAEYSHDRNDDQNWLNGRTRFVGVAIWKAPNCEAMTSWLKMHGAVLRYPDVKAVEDCAATAKWWNVNTSRTILRSLETGGLSFLGPPKWPEVGMPGSPFKRLRDKLLSLSELDKFIDEVLESRMPLALCRIIAG